MKTIQCVRLFIFAVVLALFGIGAFAQSRPPAEIQFHEMHFRTPPLVELVFDIVLRNNRTQPRWFLIPSNLNPKESGIPSTGGVDGLEVFAPTGKGRVVLGHFLGTGGFQALLLPAHGEIHLRALPISYWGDVPDDLRVEIIVAKRLIINGESARKWFQVNPMSSTGADITEAISGRTRMLHSRHTSDHKEVTTVIDEDRRLNLPVSLKGSKQHTFHVSSIARDE
ncbi:MAG: hypothetical protein ABR555_11660 [Pyrinomonadaceae bacterium]